MPGMRRREFVTLLGGAAAWPLAARAQQGERVRRIGVLMAVAERDLEAQGYIKAFVQVLHELGWAHGRNVQIEYRWGGGNLDRIRTYAAELVGLKPDVVLAQTALAVAEPRRRPLSSTTSSCRSVAVWMNSTQAARASCREPR